MKNLNMKQLTCLKSAVTHVRWILLNPLPPGPHTVFFHAVLDFGGGNIFETQVTYNLTVGL